MKGFEWVFDDEAIILDGFDGAIIGVDMEKDSPVYEYALMVSILKNRDEMSDEEAIEYLDYNVFGLKFPPEQQPTIVMTELNICQQRRLKLDTLKEN